MDKAEVRRTPDPDPPRVGVAEYRSALPGCRAERQPWLKPGLDQRLHLPRQVTSPD